MRYNWFENATPGLKIMLSIAFMATFLLIGMFLSVLFAIPFWGNDILKTLTAGADMHSATGINILKYLQTFQSIFLFVLPPLVLPFFFGQKPTSYLYLKERPTAKYALLAILILICAVPFINFTERINSLMKLPSWLSGIESWMKDAEKNAQSLTEAFLKTSTVSGLLLNLFIMALIPAVGEEFVFRGLFQRIFTEWAKNAHWGIIIAAAVFSSIHFQFYGFIPRFLLGVMFGYLLLWSGSIWLPVLAHFLNNALGVIFFYLNFNHYTSIDIDKAGVESASNTPMLFASVFLTGILLFYFWKKKKQHIQD